MTTWIALEQSSLVPDANRSRHWPSTVAMEMKAPGPDTRPLENSRGQLYISAASRAAMTAMADHALEALDTPQSFSGSDYWVAGSLAAESGEGFQVVGAGQYPIAMHMVSQTATSAVITVRVQTWEHQVYQLNTGKLRKHNIANQGVYSLTLAKANGKWLIANVEFGVVAGEGP